MTLHPEIKEARIKDLQTVLKALCALKKLAIKAYANPRYGICSSVRAFTLLPSCYSDWFKIAWRDWPLFSGDITYPVPSPAPKKYSPSQAYHNLDCWSGTSKEGLKYASWRMNLLNFLIDWFEDVIKQKRKPMPNAKSQRKDARWEAAAREWLQAANRLKKAEESELNAKQKLIKLAPKGAEGCGVKLIRCDDPGRIAYGQAFEVLMPDANLEPFRGQPFTFYKVALIAPQPRRR